MLKDKGPMRNELAVDGGDVAAVAIENIVRFRALTMPLSLIQSH